MQIFALSSGAGNTMGRQITDLDFAALNDESIASLGTLIARHGVVVVTTTPSDFSSDDLLAFATRFGSPVPVPNGFGFNSSNRADTESFITNISNFDPVTNQVRSKMYTAEYLHNDGDFWQDNYILSFVYGDLIPPRGGNTQFIDLQLALDFLRQHHGESLDAIKNRRVAVDVNQIPDFEGSDFLDAFNAEHGVATHDMVHHHRVTKKACLYYACKTVSVEGLALDESARLLGAIDKILMSAQGIGYEHEWTQGQMLIWDNTRVMHRAMGGYQSNRRKLWRVQARLDQRYRACAER